MWFQSCDKPINDAFRMVYDLLAYTALGLAILVVSN